MTSVKLVNDIRRKLRLLHTILKVAFLILRNYATNC